MKGVTDMTKTIYKILGKRGRITIPWEIRKVLVKREKICDGCKNGPSPEPKNTSDALKELLDDLTPEELRTALIHLSVRWAEMQQAGGDGDA